MLSPSHENLVELFRQRSELAPALLQTCARLALPHLRTDHGPTDLTQAMPVEFRPDQVVRLYGPDNQLSVAVIVEVQLGRDARKRLSWPAYLAMLRARLCCDVILLVLAPDKSIATWARQVIELGHPGFALRPIVLSAEDIPQSFDKQAVLKLPELAMLSALTHVNREAISSAMEAIRLLSEDDQRLYLDFIRQAIDRRRAEGAAPELEKDMEKYDPRDPEMIRRFGEEWDAIQRSNKLYDATRAVLMSALEKRLGTVSAEERDVVYNIYEHDEAMRVITAVWQAADADAVRAILAETSYRTRKILY